MDVLVEVHSYYRRQVEIGRSVDLVYDFALPPLVLHALYTGDGSVLAEWMRRASRQRRDRPGHARRHRRDRRRPGPDRPARRAAPPRPPGPGADRRAGATASTTAPAGASALATGAAASNLDLYQVNSTFYDALGRDDRAYLAARAIQLFTPGIPQVYYVGALAGGNDLDLLARTGVGRDINRHHYTPEEVDAALARPVVAALLALCRFRNTVPAFDGDVEVALDGSVLRMTRRGVAVPAASARLTVDLADARTTVEWTTADGTSGSTSDLLTAPPRA